MLVYKQKNGVIAEMTVTTFTVQLPIAFSHVQAIVLKRVEVIGQTKFTEQILFQV